MKTREFQKALISWFQIEARDLPWRETSDPYKIWISEIMCQQTGVSTVVPYYERFTKAFPNVRTLAAAPEEKVLKLWEGLGYYSRARNLHKASKMLLEEFAGKLPKTLEEIKRLPGIGAYSAGAILSIAHQVRAPALDGNLIRVYARYFGIKDPVDDPKTLKRLWAIAEDYVPRRRSELRDFTEGMMELGATVCKPKKVKCSECPLQKSCAARKLSLVENIPLKSKKTKRIQKYEIVYLVKTSKGVRVAAKGFDPKYPGFRRLPFKELSKPPRLEFGMKEFKYAVTNRDFKVYVKMATPPKSVVSQTELLNLGRVEEVLLPAIDRKILKSYF